MKFDQVGIVAKQDISSVKDTADRVYGYLKKRGCSVLIDDSADKIFEDHDDQRCNTEQLGESSDVVIVIGGDGTFLQAARTIALSETPLIGINVGRLGFLVDVSPAQLEDSLDEIFDGKYKKENRCLLYAEVLRNDEVIFSADALNDVVVHVREVARMMEYETNIDGVFVNHQRADGLIIATPTGSTAYSLSSGGPLLHPTLDVITVVPICPHTLSNRPIVVNSDSVIDVLISETKQAKASVTCDGQTSFDIETGDHLIVKKLSHMVTILHPSGYDHYHTLREKLRWSSHPQN